MFRLVGIGGMGKPVIAPDILDRATDAPNRYRKDKTLCQIKIIRRFTCSGSKPEKPEGLENARSFNRDITHPERILRP